MPDPSRYAGFARLFTAPPPPTAADNALPPEWWELIEKIDRLERRDAPKQIGDRHEA